MSFGNGIGADVEVDEATLFDNSYGSIVVESTEPLDFPAAELLGHTEAEESLTINGEKMPLEELYRANTERFATVYPDKGINHAPVMEAMPALRSFTYPGEAVERPVVSSPYSRAATATTTPRRPSAGRVPKCAARCSAT